MLVLSSARAAVANRYKKMMNEAMVVVGERLQPADSRRSATMEDATFGQAMVANGTGGLPAAKNQSRDSSGMALVSAQGEARNSSGTAPDASPAQSMLAGLIARVAVGCSDTPIGHWYTRRRSFEAALLWRGPHMAPT
ncbi:hypothetical protein SASPL_148174 [Salvia splendens]|uniref:Uncharacterized protein n=1 Tax=Salvia splendens TaxID=180675 RepID=A0A8X8W9C8_SALSN|nr:hypothetical protein SASPL_148174 [Salvia splendens]